MVEIHVEKMTCGGCASRVTKAVLSQDEDAKVNVDLKTKRIYVTSTSEVSDLVQAISSAGYPARVANEAA
ncbi:heavy-metal-associated domain-containing protein [Herbaspirillum sp. GCM10030257]|jgi:copper chaperone|uniref:heavy-metal-associated domain-containing protein n=1 Tax=Herbaspirillum sp. GCM10030257 TaxID=3273393 RepID=UPI00361BDB32